MAELRTIQEYFIELYYQSEKKNDVARYHEAKSMLEDELGVYAPYGSYHSFKNALRFWLKKEK